MRLRPYLIVAEAMVALTLARAATVLPFRWKMKREGVVAGAPVELGRLPEELRARAVSLALARAQRRLPWKTSCLVAALAARAMLRRRGIDSVLRFGVRRGADGRLGAHAWLEAGGGVVCGGPAAEGFAPLAGFARKRSAW
jgi:hypothetical protein